MLQRRYQRRYRCVSCVIPTLTSRTSLAVLGINIRVHRQSAQRQEVERFSAALKDWKGIGLRSVQFIFSPGITPRWTMGEVLILLIHIFTSGTGLEHHRHLYHRSGTCGFLSHVRLMWPKLGSYKAISLGTALVYDPELSEVPRYRTEDAFYNFLLLPSED
jgi:hypothetical protein